MRYISAIHAALSFKHDGRHFECSFYEIPTILFHDGGFFQDGVKNISVSV